MITSNPIRALTLIAALFAGAGAAAQADECETMTKVVQVMIDKMDPAAKGGDKRPACARLTARASD
jgi:signal recognition particle GTPase